jgi:hypothetical protein
MNISLEEQIEYMREHLERLYSEKIDFGIATEVARSRAILATLETVMDERTAKVAP